MPVSPGDCGPVGRPCTCTDTGLSSVFCPPVRLLQPNASWRCGVSSTMKNNPCTVVMGLVIEQEVFVSYTDQMMAGSQRSETQC